MAVERALHEHPAAEADHDVVHAAEQTATTQFHDKGKVPAVGSDHDAAPRPSASELAYDGGQPFITGDLMYEQLAHRFAYRDALTAEDQQWLKEQGLQMTGIVHGRHGFAMMKFAPLPGFDGVRRPVVAFRGSDDIHDAIDDFNGHGVGAGQMAANEGLIAKTLVGMQKYGKEPAVTGHSLGGALAQMAAARFPDLVGKVVTFQAPGISREMVKRVEDANAASKADGKGETVYSHHYQVNGDLVGKSGEAFTPGDVSQIQRPTGYLLRHTGYVTDFAEKHPEAKKKIDSKEQKSGKLEGLRAGFGKFLGALQQITNTGPEEYIDVWETVRDAVDAQQEPEKIRALIDHSRLSRNDKTYMREQLDEVIAAEGFTARDPELDIRTAE